MKSLSMHAFSRARWSPSLGAILTALALAPLPAHAAQPQSVQGTDVYLWMDTGQGQPNPGGRIRSHVRGIAIMNFNTPLLQGRLQWEGDLNMDTDANGTLAVTGTIELGTWNLTQIDPDTNPPLFTPTDGKWVTKAEAHGNFNTPDLNTGYVGICVAHGISGPVEGMAAVLPFTGGPAAFPFGVTVVDVYEDGLLLDPHAAK